jgi:hypothetical protein
MNGCGVALANDMKAAWRRDEGVQQAAEGVLTLLDIKRRV